MIVDRARAAKTLPASWPDPDDINPLRREPRLVEGQMRYSVIRALCLRRPELITPALYRAADRLARDVEAAGSAYPLTADLAGVGGQSGVTPRLPSDRALDAVARVRGAKQALGALWEPVAWIVLGNRSVALWAALRGVSSGVAHGCLVAALTDLADYFDRQRK